jgi:hypothetical protein
MWKQTPLGKGLMRLHWPVGDPGAFPGRGIRASIAANRCGVLAAPFLSKLASRANSTRGGIFPVDAACNSFAEGPADYCVAMPDTYDLPLAAGGNGRYIAFRREFSLEKSVLDGQGELASRRAWPSALTAARLKDRRICNVSCCRS